MAYNLPEPAGTRIRKRYSAALLAASASLLLLFGCAAPGVPVTRQPTVPRAIADLSAKQIGDSVVLSFSLPKDTVQGKPLSKAPAIEIYRAFTSAPATGANTASAQPQLITTIPPQMVAHYQKGERLEFPDALTPAEIVAHRGGEVVYIVRTRLGRHDSGDSNVVQVLILPAIQPINDLRAEITKAAVNLTWTTPTILPKDSPPLMSLRYRVYRSDLSAPEKATVAANSGEAAEPKLLGESTAPSYSDSQFAFGHTYVYSVRSVATYENGSVESADSNVLDVTPRDTFAPATPENVAVTVTPASNSVAAHVDLSWAISTESDLLGYNLYRSDTVSASGARVNATPLITPVFRDDSVVPGKQYFYRVTAVDRSGNESAPSASVAVTVPIATEQ
ncbi:MAG TPA: fibronectin type III domain-containing protein [Candidatus Acidoferrales bacterium]|nr:fibronectin type III domain-containing protein [Candidatus Acidoferrales bacterium]